VVYRARSAVPDALIFFTAIHSPVTQSQLTDYADGTKHSINFFLWLPFNPLQCKQTGGKLGFRLKLITQFSPLPPCSFKLTFNFVND